MISIVTSAVQAGVKVNCHAVIALQSGVGQE
jgi:hypothetical protein